MIHSGTGTHSRALNQALKAVNRATEIVRSTSNHKESTENNNNNNMTYLTELTNCKFLELKLL